MFRTTGERPRGVFMVELSRATVERVEALFEPDWRDVLVAAGFGSDVEAHRVWVPRADL